MGSPFNHSQDAYTQFGTGALLVADPGSGGTFELLGRDRAYAVIASGTRKLPDAVPRGVVFRVYATGSVTITTFGGSTVATMSNGQIADFTPLSTTTWAVVVYNSAGTVPPVANLGNAYTTLTTTNYLMPIPVTAWREIATGAVLNGAGNGGVLASDTTPTLTATNGATDPTPIITWAASNNDALLAHIPVPHDLEVGIGGSLVFGCNIKSGGTTNAVGFTVLGYSTVGGEVSGTTGTNQTTSYAVKTATIDISGGELAISKYIALIITPASHTTDTLVMKEAWLVGNKKLLTS